MIKVTKNKNIIEPKLMVSWKLAVCFYWDEQRKLKKKNKNGKHLIIIKTPDAQKTKQGKCKKNQSKKEIKLKDDLNVNVKV